MRILFNNVNFESRSGPNGFAGKLARMLQNMGHIIVADKPDVSLNFIQGHYPGVRNVLRLDGIYFNMAQDWKKQNEPIRMSYELADAVVVQSQFNKELVFRYFGEKENVHVIHNGTPLKTVDEIEPAQLGMPRGNVWFCASSWRPHKRLADNISYFQHYAKKDDVLLVAGSGDIKPLENCNDPRVKYIGDLSWGQLISVMKASSNFIHLAYLDHCPNVVVDANASGCTVHCTSSGGTSEIAGNKATIVKEEVWDFKPTHLYNPPSLDFSNTVKNNTVLIANDISDVALKYEEILL
jgi:hypothetical protein